MSGKVKSESHSVMPNSLRPHGLYSPWNSPGQNTGVGSLSLLQQIFSTQESNWGVLHRRGILYQLSYQGSPIKDRVDFNNTANRLICVVLSFLIMTPPCCFPISLRSLFEGLFFLIQFIASLAPPWSTDLK